MIYNDRSLYPNPQSRQLQSQPQSQSNDLTPEEAKNIIEKILSNKTNIKDAINKVIILK